MEGLFRSLLAASGVQPAVTVTRISDGKPLPCTEIWRYGGVRLPAVVAVQRTPKAVADSTGEGTVTGGQALEKPERVRITLPERCAVTNLRTGEKFGMGTAVEATLDPWSPLLLKCAPVEAR